MQNVLTYSCKHSKEGRTFFFFFFSCLYLLLVNLSRVPGENESDQFFGGFCYVLVLSLIKLLWKKSFFIV